MPEGSWPEGLWVALALVVGYAIAAFGRYFVTRLQARGTIIPTAEIPDVIRALQPQISALREDVAVLRDENQVLRTELAAARDGHRKCEEDNAKLTARVQELSDRLERLDVRVNGGR